MFPFYLLLEKYRQKKPISKNCEPLFESELEVRETLKKLHHCPNCQFLIFDNYWTDELEKREIKVCPTCGWKI